MAGSGSGRYSCESAAQMAEWINAIVGFIKPYAPLIDHHVVNFFKDRLWESVDKEWMNCLRREPVHSLILIPSCISQDHWPASLKEFIETLRSISFPLKQVDLEKVILL